MRRHLYYREGREACPRVRLRPSRAVILNKNANRGSALFLVWMVIIMLTAAVLAFVTLVIANLDRAN